MIKKSANIGTGLTAALQDAERKIYALRGLMAMLAQDLAQLHGVKTRLLLQSVRRATSRFPEDFAFSLTNQHLTSLRSQIVISNGEKRGLEVRAALLEKYRG